MGEDFIFIPYLIKTIKGFDLCFRCKFSGYNLTMQGKSRRSCVLIKSVFCRAFRGPSSAQSSSYQPQTRRCVRIMFVQIEDGLFRPDFIKRLSSQSFFNLFPRYSEKLIRIAFFVNRPSFSRIVQVFSEIFQFSAAVFV